MQGIGVENHLLGVNVFTDERHNVFTARIGHDAERGLARAVDSSPLDSAYNGSEMGSSGFLALHHPFAVVTVHEPRLAADEGFINFHLPVELLSIGLQRETQTRQHEPRGFLSHAECSGQFVRTYAVLAIGDEPERREPLLKAKSGVLENGSDLERELALGMFGVALVPALSSEPSHVFRPTGRARHFAIGPADGFDCLTAIVEIPEVNDGFSEGFGLAVYSEPIVRQIRGLVKYIITLKMEFKRTARTTSRSVWRNSRTLKIQL